MISCEWGRRDCHGACAWTIGSWNFKKQVVKLKPKFSWLPCNVLQSLWCEQSRPLVCLTAHCCDKVPIHHCKDCQDKMKALYLHPSQQLNCFDTNRNPCLHCYPIVVDCHGVWMLYCLEEVPRSYNHGPMELDVRLGGRNEVLTKIVQCCLYSELAFVESVASQCPAPMFARFFAMKASESSK